MKKHFRIVVVDDNELIRHGLCRMLESEKDMRVVGDFASADGVIQQVGTLSPDVVLMDAEMPGKNGIEATHHLKNNGLNCQAEVIILAECADYLIGALAAGAAGYIYKNVNGGELAQVIRQVSLKQKTAKDSDSVLEETVELVLPPSTEPAKTLKFIDQVEKRLQASVMRTVGSLDHGSVITIALDADTVRDLLGRLKEIPDVEKAEEVPAARGLSNSLGSLRNWLTSADSPRERIAVTLN